MGTTNFSARFVSSVETSIQSDSVADGEQVFVLNEHSPRNNLVEHFVFIDGNGDKIIPTSGDVCITLSSGEDIYHSIFDGKFSAEDALSENKRKPSGYGKAEKIKIKLTGVVGASGFRCFVTQNAR